MSARRDPSSLLGNDARADQLSGSPSSPVRRIRHRWLRRSVIGVVALLLVVLAVYGWAWSSVDRSSIARAMW